jgi:hypothetical protein
MFLTKLTQLFGVLVLVSAIGLGAAVWAYHSPDGAPADPAPQERAQPTLHLNLVVEPTVSELAKARLQAAREVYKGLIQERQIGRGDGSAIAEWSPHLLEAELEVATTKADRLAALEAHLARMKDNEKIWQGRFDAGRVLAVDLTRARFARLDAELRLAKEKAK